MCNPLHVHKHEHISSTGLHSDFWIITWGKECFDRPALPHPTRPLPSVNNAYGNHAGPGDVKLPGLAENWGSDAGRKRTDATWRANKTQIPRPCVTAAVRLDFCSF